MMKDEEIINKLEQTTKDAGRHQLETLRAILERNSGVRYFEPHLRSHTAAVDAATFRQAVPLSSYDDYTDYIHRMADGILVDDDDRPLLSFDPLVCFFYSSGTSSMKPKLIPYFDSPSSKATSYLAHQGSASILRRAFPAIPSANKNLWFFYAGNVTKTKGGYKAMAASAYPLHGSNSNTSHLLSMCVSPKEVILGQDVHQQMYCHLLCGLRHCNIIGGVRAPYAVGLIKAFDLLESKWKQLCDDLENGFPSAEITDSEMRESVTLALSGPQPELSNWIQSICEEMNWGGIVAKLWPNARYVKSVMTGSMEQYYSKLKYYAGEIPLLGGDYFASECCVGINLDIMQPPELTRFVMLPTAAYFEFLPFDLEDRSLSCEQTVDISCVEVGKMYEVVVTTYRGFYRYRLGDIVKVVGFFNTSPEIEFVTRAPKTSGEIITERDLMSAMDKFRVVLRDVLATEIKEFTSFLDLELKPKQLKIFLEVGDVCEFLQKEPVMVFKRCCSSLEDGLGGIYMVMKARGEVGPLLVSVVKSGSFDRLLQLSVENGAPASQYKPPKILRNSNMVDFMEASVVLSVCVNSLDG